MGASPRSGSQGADVITAKLCPCGSWSPEWWGRDTNPSSSTVKALAGLRGNAVYLFLHIHLPGNRPQLEAPGLKLWERPSFGRAYTARSGRHRQIHEARYAHTITDIPSISFEKNREKRSSVLSINFPSWTRGTLSQHLLRTLLQQLPAAPPRVPSSAASSGALAAPGQPSMGPGHQCGEGGRGGHGRRTAPTQPGGQRSSPHLSPGSVCRSQSRAKSFLQPPDADALAH